MKICELRHLDEIKGNFGLGDGVYYRASAKTTESSPPPLLISSTLRALVEQQQYFFDMLWNKAETADERIREIEEGIKPDFIKTIRDPYEVQKLVFDLINGANKEILVMFSTANAFQRQTKSGAVRLLKKASLRGLKVRVLTPFDEKVEKIMKEELGTDDNSKASTNGNMVNHDKDKQKQDQLRKYMAAISDAIAFVQKDEANNFSGTLKCLQKYDIAALKDPAVATATLKEYVTSWTQGGDILTTDEDTWQAVYKENVGSDFVPSGKDPSKWFTNDYVPSQ